MKRPQIERSSIARRLLLMPGFLLVYGVSFASEPIETNRKVVDGIYLSTIGKDVDTFTVAQADELFTIANQCPMLGGNAVYTARALYQLVDPEQEFDDALLCLPHGILVKSMRQGQTIGMSLHPNPAREEVMLMLEQSLDHPGQFIVYNALGAVAMHAPLEAEAVQHILDTRTLPPGLYQYQVRGPTGLVGTGKLAIIR